MIQRRRHLPSQQNNNLKFRQDHHLEEKRKAIKSLNDGKSPGIDRIQAEMVKGEEYLTTNYIISSQKYLKIYGKNEKAPTEYKIGLLIKLSKKKDLTDTNNWIGIMLISGKSYHEAPHGGF